MTVIVPLNMDTLTYWRIEQSFYVTEIYNISQKEKTPQSAGNLIKHFYVSYIFMFLIFITKYVILILIYHINYKILRILCLQIQIYKTNSDIKSKPRKQENVDI